MLTDIKCLGGRWLPAQIEFHVQRRDRGMINHERPAPDPATARSAVRQLEGILQNAVCGTIHRSQVPAVPCRRIFRKLNLKRVADKNFHHIVVPGFVENKHPGFTPSALLGTLVSFSVRAALSNGRGALSRA